MERKPFDRFNDKPARREGRFEDRSRGRFSDREDRFERRGRFDEERPRSFARREDRDGRDGRDNREGRESRGFGSRSFERRPERREKPRFEFGKASGPRAKAMQTRRHLDRAAFVQSATVRLDADVAKFFPTAESVNDALRQVIALARMVKIEQVSEVSAEAESADAAEIISETQEAAEAEIQAEVESSEELAEEADQQ